jgi:pimeloyl-ACP methyl ester carboxylesterase
MKRRGWHRVLGIVLGVPLVGIALVLGTALWRERGDRLTAPPVAGTLIGAYDTRLFVQREGNPLAPAVLFVAGTGGWSGLWHLSMATAVKQGYQAIAVDLPPFGYSPLPASQNYSKALQGRRLIGLLDSLHLEHVTIVAHSIGAAPVMEAVFSAPKQVERLVLVDPALSLDSPQTAGSDSTLQALFRHESVAWPVSALLTNPLLTTALLERVISEKDKATPEWVRIYQAPLTLTGASRAIAHWLPEVLAPRGHQKSDELDSYARLKIPVTLIWGATDTITPLSQGRHLEQLIAGSTLILIPRAGHGPQFEEPALFDQALISALARAP